MTARRYKRVSAVDSIDGEEPKKNSSVIDRNEFVKNKIHAFFWVMISIGAIVYTDFIKIALFDKRTNRYFR
jgi:hypothetical protein